MKRRLEVILPWMVEKGYSMTSDGKLFNPKGKNIKGSLNGRGPYWKVSIRCGDIKSYAVKFHKFQGYLKFGDTMFDKGMVIRHLDGDSTNNAWDNIGIGTQKDNMQDIPKEKRRVMAMSPRKHNHEAIIADREAGMSYEKIMKKYNITSKGSVSYIINKSMAN